MRQDIFGLQADSTAPERFLLSLASLLNFIPWVAPGGSRLLLHARTVVNDPGIMESWRSGASCAETQVVVTKELRNDMLWWRRALEARTAGGLHAADRGVSYVTLVCVVYEARRCQWAPKRRSPRTRTHANHVAGERLLETRTFRARGPGSRCVKASIGKNCGF